MTGPEAVLLKQQFETIKQAVIQTKGATSTIVKDNKDIKFQVDNLINELNETKGLLIALQNLTMENSTKILELSSIEFQNMNDFSSDFLEGNIDFPEMQDTQNDNEAKETVGNEIKEMVDICSNNLKNIIESEMNAEI